MSLDSMVKLVVTVAVFEIMVTVGLGVAVADVIAIARDGRLLARAALANYGCVPAATVVLLVMFDAHPMVAAGFIVLAVCPGAPFGPALAILAAGWLLGGRGDESRKTLALTTATRNVGVGLVIATDAFRGTPVVAAVLAYGLVGVIGSLLIAWSWGRRRGERRCKTGGPVEAETS